MWVPRVSPGDRRTVPAQHHGLEGRVSISMEVKKQQSGPPPRDQASSSGSFTLSPGWPSPTPPGRGPTRGLGSPLLVVPLFL